MAIRWPLQSADGKILNHERRDTYRYLFHQEGFFDGEYDPDVALRVLGRMTPEERASLRAYAFDMVNLVYNADPDDDDDDDPDDWWKRGGKG